MEEEPFAAAAAAVVEWLDEECLDWAVAALFERTGAMAAAAAVEEEEAR
jgi:hypothetical protein